MTPIEQAFVELARAGLDGDSISARRTLERFLKRPPNSDGTDASLRGEIALSLSRSGRATRSAEPTESWTTTPTLEVDTVASNVLVERPEQAPPPVLNADADVVVRRIIDERKSPERLAAAGVHPTRSLLLTGAPGVGKTMTARHLASELQLPLVSIDLALVVSSFLGKTGQNLRGALEYARSAPCVLLVDEFDAVAKRRDDPTDVGEQKRIVNVLLLELERWPPTHLLIAATNHAELLDRAIWRRFERVLQLNAPDANARRLILKRAFDEHSLSVNASSVDTCAAALEGASGSDLVTFAHNALREHLVETRGSLDETIRQMAIAQLAERVRSDPSLRATYCEVAHSGLGRTQREIASELGVSHVTVGKLLRSRSSGRDAQNRGPRGHKR